MFAIGYLDLLQLETAGAQDRSNETREGGLLYDCHLAGRSFFSNKTREGGLLYDCHLTGRSFFSFLPFPAAYFDRSYADNLRGDYLIWTETAGGGGTQNFITGTGGFLQCVWAGTS